MKKTAVSKAVPAKAPAKPIKKTKKDDDDEAYTTNAGKVQKEKDPNAPKRP